MNALANMYPEEVKRILAKYPDDQKRSAVMPLLYLAQSEAGYVDLHALQDIAELCEISPTDVAGIVGFYTLYHEHPGGKIRIQVCNDLPCALRGADEFLQKLCESLGIKVGETTPDGLVTVEAVMCLAGCDHAPLFQVQSGDGLKYYQDQTVESALQVVEAFRSQTPAGSAAPEPAKDDVPGNVPGDVSDPVAGVAQDGTSSRTRDEWVRIMEEGGQ